MNLLHRQIDFINDRDYVLERHCRINYECDSPWKRGMPYEAYRQEWFSLSGQVTDFYDYLKKTAEDLRTIAEIIESENGCTAGYLWVPFIADAESGFCFAQIQDIYVEEACRRAGIAGKLLRYAENRARLNGARVIRSGTGCENIKSIRLHEKQGYAPYRYEFEKILRP